MVSLSYSRTTVLEMSFNLTHPKSTPTHLVIYGWAYVGPCIFRSRQCQIFNLMARIRPVLAVARVLCGAAGLKAPFRMRG